VIVTVEFDAPFLLAVYVHLVEVSKVRERGERLGRRRKEGRRNFALESARETKGGEREMSTLSA